MKIYLGLVCILIIFFSISAQSDNNTINETIPSVSITKFFPKEVRVGDVQLNIQIQNNLDRKIENIPIFVYGEGFSVYRIIPIDELMPLERDYIFIDGNFKKSGIITLTLEINEEIFYQNISVFDLTDEQKEELRKIEILKNFSIELDSLKKNYTLLEIQLAEKKDNNYDVSKINLDELKRYIRNVESAIILEDIDAVKVNLNLASEEYFYQKQKIDNAERISFATKFRENAPIISATIASFLGLFALSELLKKHTIKITSSIKNLTKNKKRNKKKKRF